MSKWFQETVKFIALAGINFATADIRCALLMTGNSAAADYLTAVFIDDITDLEEFDGAGYAREALTGEAVTIDNPDVLVKFDAGTVDFGALVPGSAAIIGHLFYLHVGADTANRPLFYYDGTPYAFTPNGGTYDFDPDAIGGFITFQPVNT